jgi:uncharacterized protein YcbK (DUF882 family)
MGDLSAHFSRAEFACPDCGLFIHSETLLTALERLRAHTGRPLRILSGTRCRRHNAAVGGAPNSQHLHGLAADIPAGYAAESAARAAGFTGVGLDRNGRVIHVDVRQGPPARWVE